MAHSVNSFFQIIINSTFLEGKLKFPNKYVHDYGSKLHDTVRLSIPTGCCWDVRVKREADGTIWLHDGFLQFMEDNSIGIEYFLIFKGEGNSKFIVCIFDLTATEILYKCSNDSGRLNDVDELQMDETRKVRDCSFNHESSYEDSDNREDDSSENGSSDEDSDDHIDDDSNHDSGDADVDDDDDDSPTNQGGHKDPVTRRKRLITEGGLDANGSIPKTDTTIKYSKKANQSRDDGSNISPRDIAKEKTTRAKKVQPMVPNSFQVHIKPYHITKGLMRFPCTFARSHMCCSTRLIKLVDADNKEWEVQYLHQERSYILSKGWGRFVQDKGLKVGDICDFERIGSNNEVKLKVTII